MAGKIKALCDSIITQRGRGNPTFIATTKTKLMLKGIDVDKFNSSSPDDPAILAKLEQLATELGVTLR